MRRVLVEILVECDKDSDAVEVVNEVLSSNSHDVNGSPIVSHAIQEVQSG